MYSAGKLNTACNPVTVPVDADKAVPPQTRYTCVPHVNAAVEVQVSAPSEYAPELIPQGSADWKPLISEHHPKSVNRMTVPAVISFKRTKLNSSSLATSSAV